MISKNDIYFLVDTSDIIINFTEHMKFIYSIIFLSIQFVSLSQSNSFIFESDSNIQSTNLSVMTYNIRYNNPDDGTNAWVYRRKRLLI